MTSLTYWRLQQSIQAIAQWSQQVLTVSWLVVLHYAQSLLEPSRKWPHYCQWRCSRNENSLASELLLSSSSFPSVTAQTNPIAAHSTRWVGQNILQQFTFSHQYASYSKVGCSCCQDNWRTLIPPSLYKDQLSLEDPHWFPRAEVHSGLRTVSTVSTAVKGKRLHFLLLRNLFAHEQSNAEPRGLSQK